MGRTGGARVEVVDGGRLGQGRWNDVLSVGRNGYRERIKMESVGKESGAQGRVVTGRPEMAAFGDRREAVKNRVLGTSQDAERPK